MKRNKLLLLLLLLIFILPVKTHASNICTSTKYNNLKKEAYKSQFSYELKFDEKHNHHFEVTAYNVSPDVMIIFNGSEYLADKNGQVKFVSYFEGGQTYEFNFYGGRNNSCVEEYVYTKKLDIPKYNVYSEREECIEYEEFPLCNKWYKGEIVNEVYFVDQLEAFKKTLDKETPEIKKVENKDWIEQFIDFYTHNIVLCVTITVILALLIIVIIIRRLIRRKRRVKLNF